MSVVTCIQNSRARAPTHTATVPAVPPSPENNVAYSKVEANKKRRDRRGRAAGSGEQGGCDVRVEGCMILSVSRRRPHVRGMRLQQRLSHPSCDSPKNERRFVLRAAAVPYRTSYLASLVQRTSDAPPLGIVGMRGIVDGPNDHPSFFVFVRRM